MISTGNDIVALKAINIARSTQVNFYSKIFVFTEKYIYDNQFSDKLTFEKFIWLVWSVKESVYKYQQRITPELIFSPTKITITQLELYGSNTITTFKKKIQGFGFNNKTVYKGIVTFDEQTLYSRTIINEEFIFSVVNQEDNFENTGWGVQLISSADPEYQSRVARVFLADRLNVMFHGDIQINKSPHGYPILFKDEVELPVAASIAHHDHYVGYSFQIKK